MLIKTIHILKQLERLNRELHELQNLKTKTRSNRLYSTGLCSTIDEEMRRVQSLKEKLLNLQISRETILDHLGYQHELAQSSELKESSSYKEKNEKNEIEFNAGNKKETKKIKSNPLPAEKNLKTSVRQERKETPFWEQKKKEIASTFLEKDSAQSKRIGRPPNTSWENPSEEEAFQFVFYPQEESSLEE